MSLVATNAKTTAANWLTLDFVILIVYQLHMDAVQTNFLPVEALVANEG